MMQCWLLQCRSFQQSRIEAAGVENKASASIISRSSSRFFLFLSLDLDGEVVKNINAARDRTCLRCFALCGFFSELQMERWISEQLQSLSAHSVARGPRGHLISWGTLPILVSLVFPFHYSSKYSPDFHSDFIAQRQRFRYVTF